MDFVFFVFFERDCERERLGRSDEEDEQQLATPQGRRKA